MQGMVKRKGKALLRGCLHGSHRLPAPSSCQVPHAAGLHLSDAGHAAGGWLLR